MTGCLLSHGAVSAFFAEKSPETHSEVCPQTLTLGLFAHTGECFHCVRGREKVREGKAGKQQKRPSTQSTPWCPSKRGRKAPPTGCGLRLRHHGGAGQTAYLKPSCKCHDWVKSHMLARGRDPRGRGPSGPVLTPSHLPLPCTGALTKG